MRVLVVDDELVSRTKLEAILEVLGECHTVDGGKAAVTAVTEALHEGAPFDLITLDIAMPDMSGMEVLHAIRVLEAASGIKPPPRAKILMVTAQSSRDSLIMCVQAGCDDYIIKPFDRETILQRLITFDARVKATAPPPKRTPTSGSPSDRGVTEKVSIGQEVIRRFKRGEINLPSPSGLYVQFKRLLEEGAGLTEIAELLKKDIGISFHLISVSNSVYYRGVKESRTLVEALGRLGLDITHKYVDILCNRGIYTASHIGYAPFMDRLWEHSISCALASEILVERLKCPMAVDAFTLGLLHDVGKMVLIQIVSELETRGKVGQGVNRAEVLDTLDAHHGEFGEIILAQWKFAEEFSRVARYHDKEDGLETAPPELAVVHLANLLSKAEGYGQVQPLEMDLLDTPSARRLGVDAPTLDYVKEMTAKRMEETRRALA